MATAVTRSSSHFSSTYDTSVSEPTPTSPNGYIGETEAARLPAPNNLAISGDAAAEVAALLVTAFSEDRKHVRASSDLEEANRLREGEMRVAELHNKADQIRAEGLERGLMQIGGAACSIGGGAVALGASKDTVANAALAIGSGGEKGFEAGGTMLGNDHQADAVECEAEADRHESIAEARKTARDKFNDEATDAKQMIQRVIDFVKELNDIRNATLQAAASLKA